MGEQTLLTTTIIFLAAIIFLLFIVIGFLFYYLFKNKNEGAQYKKVLNKEFPVYKCEIHKDRDSDGSCAICEKTFCQDCLKKNENLSFCPEHFELFFKETWADVWTIKTTPDRPEKAKSMYDLKNQMWQEKGIPTYIVTHYKINFEQDHIESWVILFSRESDKENLLENISSQ